MSKYLIEQKNTLLGLLAIAIWSFAALLAVELTSIPPFELLTCELLIAFFILMMRYSFSKQKKSFLNFSKKDFLIASIALVVNLLCYFLAFRHAPAAQVDLINYLWPTLLIILTSLLPNEKLYPSYLIACLVCLLGVYTLLSADGGQALSADYFLGYFFGLGAAVSWALYSLYSRYRGESNSANCISCACGPAAFICLLFHIAFEEFVIPSSFESVLILITGVFPIGLASYFWERGLKKGCIKFLSLSSYSIPILSVLLLVVFGKADFESSMIIAALMISASPLFPLFADKFKIPQLQPIQQKEKAPQFAG